MSLGQAISSYLNVDAGRDPAEIGVSEYQKPDLQHLERLAAIQSKIKAADIEEKKANLNKLSEIYTKIPSSTFAYENAITLNKKVKEAKDKTRELIGNDINNINDPFKRMQIQQMFDGLEQYAKTATGQQSEIVKKIDEFQKDKNGQIYNRQYADDWTNAVRGNLEDYATKNPNSEVSQQIQKIQQLPVVQNVKDADERNMLIRGYMLMTIPKKGIIATSYTKTPAVDFDIVHANSKNGNGEKDKSVSEVAAYNAAMNHFINGKDEPANMMYPEIHKQKLLHTFGDDENKYNEYLNNLKQEYATKYQGMATEYKNEETPMKTLNTMPSPDKISEDQLMAFDYAKTEAPTLFKKDASASSRTTFTANIGGGKKNDFNSTTTSNQDFYVHGLGKTRGVQTSIDYTGGNPENIKFNFPVALITELDKNGNPVGLPKMNLNTSGGTQAYNSNISNTRQQLVPVWKNKTQYNAGGYNLKKPLTVAEIEQFEKDASKGIINPNVEYKVTFTGLGKGSSGADNTNIYTFADYAQDTFKKFNDYLRQSSGDKFIPDKTTYSAKDGYDIVLKYGIGGNVGNSNSNTNSGAGSKWKTN